MRMQRCQLCVWNPDSAVTGVPGKLCGHTLCTPTIAMTEVSKNLIIERAPVSVWDRQCSGLQAYDHERWLTAAVGGTLAMAGARRRGFGGGLLAMLGATLAVRAAMGRHDYRVARHWIDHALNERGWTRKDIVNDAAEESFPASDTPSFTADIGTARR
jgi:hypothetical protein